MAINEWFEIAQALQGKSKDELEVLGFTQDEITMIEIYINPVKWAAAFLDWQARDYQFSMLDTIVNSKQTVMRLGRRLGKCLPGWVKILDPLTGKQVTIEELFNKRQASIATMDDNLKIRPTVTNQVWDNGIKEVFKVKLKSGREIDATGNHPLYTIYGWKDIDDLKPGTRVAVASQLNFFGNKIISDEEIKLIAYMIGDGNCKNNNLRFTKSNPVIIHEMQEIVKSFQCHLVHYASSRPYDYGIIKDKFVGKENPIRNLLKKYNLWDKGSYEKSIPDEIFEMPKDKIALFLSRLYATDGWTTATYNTKARLEIGYLSASKNLVMGIQHLLLRFGIQGKVTEKKVKYKNELKSYWQIGIYSKKDVIHFIEQINIYGKEDAIKKTYEIAVLMNDKDDEIPIDIMSEVESLRIQKGIKPSQMIHPNKNANARYRPQYAPQKYLIDYWGDVLESKRLKDLGASDIYWDEIISIESIGFHQTYDLTVPITHNFIANDIIVHNTEVMCISILWHAMMQPNKGPNNQYDILIIAPYEAQVDLIFERIQQLIDMSPEIRSSIERDVHHQLSLYNGTSIKGQTASTKNSTGAAATRGQRADLIILDECDYLNDSDITNILNIRNEAPERIKIIAASTPSGRRSSFYKWCTGAPTNGWRECYAPSTVNPELLKVNKDTGRTYLDELKDELTEVRYIQEVMAEFGEEAMGVYLKVHLDKAIELGQKLNIDYEQGKFEKRGPRILGVDWDKMEADTNMVGVQYIEEFGVFAPFVRAEIPRNEFTYDNAVKKIIQLNDIYNFDYIAVDAGHGEMQIEQLKLYGQRNPQSGLQHKVIRINFSEKVTVRDPITKVRDKKDIKPFMVNNTVLLLERNQFAFNPSDRKTIKQFEEYRVERLGMNGRPVYSSKNEHIHDCIMIAIHVFNMKYNDTFKVRHASLIAKIDAFKNLTDSSAKRIGSSEEKPFENNKNNTSGIISLGARMNNKSSNYKPTRGTSRGAKPSRRTF